MENFDLLMLSKILETPKICIFSDEEWSDIETVMVSLNLIHCSGSEDLGKVLVVSDRKWWDIDHVGIECVGRRKIPKLSVDSTYDVIVIDGVPGRKSKSFGILSKLCKKARRVIVIDDVPKSEDLWGRIFLIDDGYRLGSTIDEYRSRYFQPLEVGPSGDVWKWGLVRGARPWLYEKIKDVCFKKVG